MTFEQVLVKYLYQAKKVTLYGIGTITLKSEVPDNEYISKNRQTPIEQLTLEYNPKADHDDGFIAFYGTERGKIGSLAKSDIDSSLQLARQMLNIGNAYEIDGLGSIVKQSNGTLVLHPGCFIVPYADNLPKPGRLKEREVEPQNWHKTDAQEPRITAATKRILVGAAAGIVLLAILWFALSRWQSAKPQTVAADDSTLPSTTQNNTTTAPIDTILGQTATPTTTPTTIAPAAAIADTNAVLAWKAYFRTYSSSSAALKGFSFYNKTANPANLDSVSTPGVYKLYVVVNSRIADTTYKLDSMRKWYASKVVLMPQ
ncbi:MAG: hypothetical protein EAY75_13305 [Bacteroidetes bacterium]|nr:MAG: hypothetical protein EAY75_13305 [Bacteroidota bacterium]